MRGLNRSVTSAVDYRWRQRRKALEKTKSDRRLCARYVIRKEAERLEAEFLRIAESRMGHLGPLSSIGIMGRQLGKHASMLPPVAFYVHDEVAPIDAALNKEIERIIDEEVSRWRAENAGALGVARDGHSEQGLRSVRTRASG